MAGTSQWAGGTIPARGCGTRENPACWIEMGEDSRFGSEAVARVKKK